MYLCYCVIYLSSVSGKHIVLLFDCVFVFMYYLFAASPREFEAARKAQIVAAATAGNLDPKYGSKLPDI